MNKLIKVDNSIYPVAHELNRDSYDYLCQTSINYINRQILESYVVLVYLLISIFKLMFLTGNLGKR